MIEKLSFFPQKWVQFPGLQWSLWAVEPQVDVGFFRIHRDTSVENMDQGARGWEGAIS